MHKLILTWLNKLKFYLLSVLADVLAAQSTSWQSICYNLLQKNIRENNLVSSNNIVSSRAKKKADYWWRTLGSEWHIAYSCGIPFLNGYRWNKYGACSLNCAVNAKLTTKSRQDAKQFTYFHNSHISWAMNQWLANISNFLPTVKG